MHVTDNSAPVALHSKHMITAVKLTMLSDAFLKYHFSNFANSCNIAIGNN